MGNFELRVEDVFERGPSDGFLVRSLTEFPEGVLPDLAVEKVGEGTLWTIRVFLCYLSAGF